MEDKKLLKSDVAEFTWDFGNQFLLETSKGNYVWSDPDYGGDNTIRPLKGTVKDFLQPFGRCKGKHFIDDYCGSEVKIIED